MTGYKTVLASRVYRFDDLRILLAKATPRRSGDELAGIAAQTSEERIAAQMALADVPLKNFLAEPLIPYETDEITRLIFDTHDANAFSPSRISQWESSGTGYSTMMWTARFWQA